MLDALLSYFAQLWDKARLDFLVGDVEDWKAVSVHEVMLEIYVESNDFESQSHS